MRTGSFGDRNAEDMLRTLPAEKKKVISSIRSKLLENGYIEEAEYDALNVEPVLKYSKSETEVIFLRHKWELTAMIPVTDSKKKLAYIRFDQLISKRLFTDDDGNRWIKFQLPGEESDALQVLEIISE